MAGSARPRAGGTTGAVARVVGLAVTTVVAATGLELSARGASTTYATSATLIVLTASAGITLLGGAAVLALTRPRDRSGPVAAALSIAWFAPVLEGWDQGPETVRTAGMLASPFVAPLLVHLSSFWWTTRTETRFRPWIVAGGYAVTVALVLGLAVVRDPLRDAECWRNCTANILLVEHDATAAAILTSALLVTALGLAAVASVVNVATLATGSPAARRRGAPVLVPATAAAATLVVHVVALLADPADGPERSLLLWTFAAGGVSLALLGTGLVATVVRDRAVVRAVSRLTEALGPGGRPPALADVLRPALNDPALQVLYPTREEDRFLDAGGRPVGLPDDPVRTTTITRDGVHVATVVHDPSVSLDDLEREIGPRARLAVDNERLRAALLAEVATLQASRARLVTTADDSRRRLERDLHDGAQQRMLALSYEIRLALAAARNAGGTMASAALEAALSEVMAALDDLRDLAHGIFPSILDNAGLSPALETLAERSPVPLSVIAPPAERFGPAAEMAVYLLVREGTVAAARAGADEVVARFDRAPGGLVLEVRTEPYGRTVGLSAEDLWRVGDRVAAAGGNLTHEDGVVRAAIPCA